MIRIALILVLILSNNQDREIFATFYNDKFSVDQNFKKSRIKYPLLLIDSNNQTTELKSWEQRIDSLIVKPQDAIFISQNDMMLILDKKEMKIQNTFKKIEGRWYLTELNF